MKLEGRGPERADIFGLHNQEPDKQWHNPQMQEFERGAAAGKSKGACLSHKLDTKKGR